MNKDNIVTRDAHTNDEAWMLEKMNQNNMSIDNFSPREFLIAVNEETEERKGFARTEYVRNVDDTEYVEINSFVLLDDSNEEFGCQLLCDLTGHVQSNNDKQVFAFPNNLRDIFERVGFNQVSKNSLPEIMKDRFNEATENKGQDTVAVTAQTNKVSFETDDNNEYEKPNNVTEDDVEKIKDELDIDDKNTKYSV